MNMILKKMNKIKYGAVIGNRQMLFDNRGQQSLSTTRYKILNNQAGEISLEGLVIDWHLADTDQVPDIGVSCLDHQPTYAYA